MPLSRFEDINVVMSPAEIVVKEKLVRSSQEAARAKRSHRSSQSQKQPRSSQYHITKVMPEAVRAIARSSQRHCSEKQPEQTPETARAIHQKFCALKPLSQSHCSQCQRTKFFCFHLFLIISIISTRTSLVNFPQLGFGAKEKFCSFSRNHCQRVKEHIDRKNCRKMQRMELLCMRCELSGGVGFR